MASSVRCAAACILAAAAVPAKSLTWDLDSAGRDQMELWLDPYYTALNATHSLTREPIARLDVDAEDGANLWLARNFLHPRDLLVEGSVNPLPVGGWALRKWDEEGYRRAGIGGTNLVQAVSEGFPEPWAVSVFCGNVVDLVSGADTSKVNGMGYSGLLVSWGAWHLVQSRLVQEQWLETEVKIKGDDLRPDRKLGWSFRTGMRWNADSRVRDALYASAVRRRTDFRQGGWNPLRNSSLELRLDLDRRSLPRVVAQRVTAVAGKKFPFSGGAMAFCLSAGVVYDFRPAYGGDLRPLARRGLELVLQPNLEW